MYRIERAKIEDIAEIQAMADVVFRRTYHDILSADQMEYMIDWMYSAQSLERQITDEGKEFFVARDDAGKGAGYVSIELDGHTPDGRPLIHLQKIYVMPERQGTGLGALLFDHVRSLLKERYPSGCRMELNVNRHNKAVHFYQHMGMTCDRQGDFDIGNGYYMNDYIYALDL